MENYEHTLTPRAELVAVEDWLCASLREYLSTEEILERISSLRERVSKSGRMPQVVADELLEEYFNTLPD
jgi:hypothetical protein